MSVTLSKSGGPPFRITEFLHELGRHAQNVQIQFMVDGVYLPPQDVAWVCEELALNIELTAAQSGSGPDFIESVGAAIHRATLAARRRE